MSPSLPSEIRTIERADGVRFVLPHRKPSGVQGKASAPPGCIVALLLIGIILALLYAGVVADAARDGVVPLVAISVIASPMALLSLAALLISAWLTVGGRSTIALTRRRVLLREWMGPFVFPRSIPLDRVRCFRVHLFNQNNRGAIDIDLEGLGSRRWAVEYPVPLLEALASELARRKDQISGAGPKGPADVEAIENGIRVIVRPAGWMSRTVSVLAVALMLALLIGAAATWIGAVWDGRRHVAFFGILLGVFVLGWVAFAAFVFRQARRTTFLDCTGKQLRLTETDPMGRRVREWPRSEVWGFEVFQRRDSEGNSGPPELQARLSNGQRPVLLRGRDLHELEWIAGVLRRGRPRKKEVEVAGAAAAAGGGICQVCGTSMEERIVWCARCRTPHHQECWDYAGMCSTFACREIRCEKV